MSVATPLYEVRTVGRGSTYLIPGFEPQWRFEFVEQFEFECPCLFVTLTFFFQANPNRPKSAVLRRVFTEAATIWLGRCEVGRRSRKSESSSENWYVLFMHTDLAKACFHCQHFRCLLLTFLSIENDFLFLFPSWAEWKMSNNDRRLWRSCCTTHTHMLFRLKPEGGKKRKKADGQQLLLPSRYEEWFLLPCRPALSLTSRAAAQRKRNIATS